MKISKYKIYDSSMEIYNVDKSGGKDERDDKPGKMSGGIRPQNTR